MIHSIDIDKIYNEDCLDTMQRMPESSVDMVITSPPYDNLRDYKGYCFNFEMIVDELYRVVKNHCVVVWVVGDACVNGSETLTSFRQALSFSQKGFNLHDTMIYEKNSSQFPASPSSKRYTQIFEYMFVFSKGRIREDISLLQDKKNKWAGYTNWGKLSKIDKTGYAESKNEHIKPVPEYSLRNNIWKYTTSLDKGTGGHPAVFPEALARDHILSWSVVGDLVYDPFIGSGTTAKMAIENKRHYLGSEISAEYYAIAQKRIKNVQVNLF